MILEVDSEGFLINRDDWTREAMYELAKADGVELTDEHAKYILAARVMFEEHSTVTAIREFAKHFCMNRKAKELYTLFESGSMKKIAKWEGLPKPTGCV